MNNKSLCKTIEILGKTLSVKCLESEALSLQEAVDYLNDQMLKVQNNGTYQIERIVIITALNIAHQFLALKAQTNQANQRIELIQEKLDNVLNKNVLTEGLCLVEN